jgi:hypothetical protein
MPDGDLDIVVAVSAGYGLRWLAVAAVEQRAAGRNRGPGVVAAHPFDQRFDRFHAVGAGGVTQLGIGLWPSGWVSRLARLKWHDRLLDSCKCNK